MSGQLFCTKIRFTFYDGRSVYTVEYTPSLKMWFVFNQNEQTNCIKKFKVSKKTEEPNQSTARKYLDSYLEQNNKQ